MVKKLFALASVSALAGLMAATSVAGCSTTEEAGGETKDAGKDAKKAATDATAGDDDDDDDDDDVVKQCWKDDEVDVSDNPYKPPTINTSACSENAGKVVIDAINGSAKTWQDVMDAVEAAESEDCVKCVFAEDTGDTWSPVILGQKEVTVNAGGCVGIVSGDEDCGKTAQQWNECLNTACAKCEDADAQDECVQAVQSDGSACGAATAALATTCGDKVNTYLSSCGGLKGAIEKQCTPKGVTVADGGNDSGDGG